MGRYDLTTLSTTPHVVEGMNPDHLVVAEDFVNNNNNINSN